ncbi:MAG: divergent polysaccharide deacetylase family protein [Pseudomonadota bacterium]
MNIKSLKALLFFLILTIITPITYIIGLASHPTKANMIDVVEKTVLPVDHALGMGGDDAGLQARSTSPLRNPFEGGKIIDIPSGAAPSKRDAITVSNAQPSPASSQINRPIPKAKSSDPRFTRISSDAIEYYDTEDESDQVIVEIPGMESEEPLSNAAPKIQSAALTPSKRTPIMADMYEGERQALLKAPLKGYFETGPYGPLPKQPSEGLPLYNAYGHSGKILAGTKPLAMVIGGLGMDHDLTLEAIRTLPSEVTLGFIPYSSNLQFYIDEARKYGHETIIELPLEPFDFPRQDVGHKVLLTDLDIKDYEDRLYWLLGRASGYSGVMNYLGDKYMTSDKIRPLLRDLKKRGLYFVENKTLQSGMTHDIAHAVDIPYAASFDIIDSTLTPSFINERLDLVRTALKEETPVIATGYASALTLSTLRIKLLEYRQNNIQLIPISAAVQ